MAGGGVTTPPTSPGPPPGGYKCRSGGPGFPVQKSGQASRSNARCLHSLLMDVRFSKAPRDEAVPPPPLEERKVRDLGEVP